MSGGSIRKNVIILGMARSGTSLTASIFARHGYFVGDQNDIAPTDHLNPAGYYESLSLTDHNARLLKESGFPKDNTWIYGEISDDQRDFLLSYHPNDEAMRSTVRDYEKRSPWVWKDPRLCYTLGCWWPSLPQSTTVAILVRRDPEAIFKSFVRVGWRKNTAQARSLTHARTQAHLENAKTILHANSIPFIEIDYADYERNPASISRTIFAHCGLAVEPDELGYRKEFNHNTAIGAIGTRLDKLVNRLPNNWVKAIKRIVPDKLLRAIYPERYQ